MSHIPSVFVDNSNVVEVRGLAVAVNDSYVNDATVTLTLKDADGQEVTGQTWPATMTYVTATDGWYRGVIEHDVELEAGVTYYAHIDADAGGDGYGHWEYAFVAKTRRST